MARSRRGSLPLPAAVAVTAVVAALLLPLAAAAKKDYRGAKITLQAKWQGTPLLHEAAEFLVNTAGGRRCLLLNVSALRASSGACATTTASACL